ncbi:hypothetical protein AX17_002191 [Amanita inopinata Kibby_2008]|nr:hypothetical protein AX17_002191 [Amanita inopinata Kibby_2008]
MDVTLSTVAFSPSGLSPGAGCIAATLSSNMDLCLWAAVKNCLKGEWKMIFDVITFLLDKLLSSDPQGQGNKTAQVLKAQIVSIVWSQPCDFGYSPAPDANSSLLIAGNRSGSLIFLRYCQDGQNVDLIDSLQVSDRWITHIAVTEWNTTEPGRCESYLAYGTADGSIGIVKLTQQLSHPPAGNGNSIALTSEKSSLLVHEPDQMGITALQWVTFPNLNRILIHCTPGSIHLHYPLVPSAPSFPPALSTWHTHTLRLKTYRASSTSSALHLPSSISYLSLRDALLVTISDGSVHVIRGVASGEPCLVFGREDVASPMSEGETETEAETAGGSGSSGAPGTMAGPERRDLTTALLSRNMRSTFVRTEHGDVDKHDVNKITGMAGYDPSNGMFIWSYEVHRPGDFSYKHDAKQKSTIAVAKLWDQALVENNGGNEDEIENEIVVQNLRSTLASIKARQAPLDVLRAVLFSFRNGKRLNVVHDRILEVLKHGVDNALPDVIAEPFEGQTSASSRKWKGKGREKSGARGTDEEEREKRMRNVLRKSLSKHLFGWDLVLNWRMRLGLADHIWKLSDTAEKRAACGTVAQALLSVITQHTYRTLVRHMINATPFLTPADVPFARHLVLLVQSLEGTPPAGLVAEGRELLDLVKDITVDEEEVKERCPACGLEVPFTNVRGAVCANGHMWTRCSITTFILSTAYVRTCIGCCRKAFLAPSAVALLHESGNPEEARLQHLPGVARGWVVEELLEAVRRCLFCGNAFVCIV